MDNSLDRINSVLQILQQRDHRNGRSSPTVTLKHQRRAFIDNIFNRTVGPRLPKTTTRGSAKPKTLNTDHNSNQIRTAFKPRSQQSAFLPNANSLDSFDTGRQTDIPCDTSSPTTKQPHPIPDQNLVSLIGKEETANASIERNKRRSPSPKPPRQRKKTRKSAPPKKSRGSRYRAFPSHSVLDRLRRSNQRLFMVKQKRVSESDVHFTIMGTNGNIYNTKINEQPNCNCPDFKKRYEEGKVGPCKHLIFVFLRVLKLSQRDPSWWQIRLLPKEAEDILENIPHHDSGILVDERVRRQYEIATETIKRKSIEGDCPVCFEDLRQANLSRPQDFVTFCTTCGHNFHELCIRNWIQVQSRPACPLCRQALKTDSKSGKENGNDYLNLMSYSSAHGRELTLAEMYHDSHTHIRRGASGNS